MQEKHVHRDSNTAEKSEWQYISVPFKEKDKAKYLGARWDRQQQSWYVPSGVDIAPFAKWIQEAATAVVESRSGQLTSQKTQGDTQKPVQQTDQPRQYLAVPYDQRNTAKAAGALWDKSVKSWYIGPHGDMTKMPKALP